MRGETENDMLAAVIPLVRAGIAVHWLRHHSKAPAGDPSKDGGKRWQDEPVHTVESLTAAYRRGYNVGVRPGEYSKTAAGYLHLIDMDIRDPARAAEAHSVMDRLWPGWRSAPFVISGSGGGSRHVYLFTDRAFRSAKLAHSDGFTLVFDAKKQRDVKKYDWEIELFGTPKQAVLPPSIHPDTLKPYVWGREIDLDALDWGIGPIVASSVVESWGAAETIEADEDDDLMAIVKSQPMGLSEDEITAALDGLPVEWVEDHDQWLQVGMALHHEYGGSIAGFERWCEWARQSSKFDLRDSGYRWQKSFREKSNPVRMATVIKAAGEERDRREMSWMDAFDGVAAAAVSAGSLVPLLPQPAAPSLDDFFGPSPIEPVGTLKDPPPNDPEWRTYFDRNEDGIVKPTVHNVELILRHDPRLRGSIAFNEFTQEIVLVRQPKVSNADRKHGAGKPLRELDAPIWTPKDTINGGLWSESHDNDLRLLIETPKSQGGYQLKTSDRDLRSAIEVVSQRQRFHPVRAYLSCLQWDRQRRVERLFIDYLGSPDNAYHREAAMLFMLGAVARVFEPGHKFDFVPILKGLQGKRKSTFIRILGRHWSSELEGDFHDAKGMVEKMQGAWILEIPELQGFSRAEVTTIKGFVSRQVDKVRLAWGKRAIEFPRQCVFMGSTNDEEFLRDPSGGRRFWVIVCMVDEIDTDRLEGEIDQLWAEAVAMYYEWRRRNPHGTLPLYISSQDARAEASRLQEAHRQERPEDSLVGEIEDWVDSPISDGSLDENEPVYRNEICGKMIWVEMMGKNRFDFPPRNQQEVATALSKLPGWRKDGNRRIETWGKQRVYVRVISR